MAPDTPARGAERTAADSGKHAFSVIEGAVKSRAIKGEGFGERGRGGLRGVGIYRRGWCPFSSIFQVFLSEVCEGSAGCVFIIFSSFLGLPGGLFLSIFRKSTAFFEIVPAPDFRIQYSVLACFPGLGGFQNREKTSKKASWKSSFFKGPTN